MSDVVKTTLLTKRWEGLWTTVPCLISEEDALEEGTGDLRTLPSDAKFLKLCVYDENIPRILNLLKMFPKMSMLVLEDSYVWGLPENYRGIVDPHVLTFEEENLVKSQKEFHKSRLVHLRTVEINWFAKASSEINALIEIMQKYASKIEKTVIRPIVFKPESLFCGSTEN